MINKGHCAILKSKKIKINDIVSQEHRSGQPEGSPICQGWTNVAPKRITTEIFKNTMKWIHKNPRLINA